jgi:hypothetical protein
MLYVRSRRRPKIFTYTPSQPEVACRSRVTRLGELSPIVYIGVYLRHIFENKKITEKFGFFHTKTYVFDLTKYGLD